MSEKKSKSKSGYLLQNEIVLDRDEFLAKLVLRDEV